MNLNDGNDNVTVSGESITAEKVVEWIREQAAAYTADTAKQFAESLKNKIQGIGTAPKGANRYDKQNEFTVGRQAFEDLCSMVRKGGKALVAVVKINFDIDEYLNEVRAKIGDLDTVVIELEGESKPPTLKPDKSNYEMEAKLNLHHQIVALELSFREEFNVRTAPTKAAENQSLWKIQGASGKKAKKQQVAPATPAPSAGVEPDPNTGASSSVSPPPAVFEQSVEYSLFLKEKETLKENSEIEWMTLFMAANKEYEKIVIASENATKGLETQRRVLKRESTIEQIVSALQMGLCCIVKQVKTQIKDQPAIIEKMRGRVKLPTTGEVIVDPYTSENVSGMYQALYSEYSKPSMVMFAKMLLEIITHEVPLNVCNSDPVRPVLDIEQTLKTWLQMGLWQYMNQDRFFVVCFLRSLNPKSDMRRACVREVTEFMRKLMDGNDDESTIDVATDLPVLTYICDWVRTVYVQSNDFDHQKASQKDGGAAPTGNNNNGTAGGVGNPGPKRPRNNNNSEQAVSANSQQEESKPLKTAAAKYNREVHRNEWIGYTSVETGKEHLYTATATQCHKCGHPNPAERHQGHRCYRGKCRKCNLFGHKKADCRQEMSNSANAAEEREEAEEHDTA
jgi:hypothetical protein